MSSPCPAPTLSHHSLIYSIHHLILLVLLSKYIIINSTPSLHIHGHRLYSPPARTSSRVPCFPGIHSPRSGQSNPVRAQVSSCSLPGTLPRLLAHAGSEPCPWTPLVPRRTSAAFIPHFAYRPPCCSSHMLRAFPPQGLCTCSSSPRCTLSSDICIAAFTFFRDLSKCPLPGAAFPCRPPPSFPRPVSLSLLRCSSYQSFPLDLPHARTCH